MEAFTVRLDGSGRILLPSKIRKQLKIRKGSELIARLSKEQLVLKTRDQALRQAQEYFSRLRPARKLWSEELAYRSAEFAFLGRSHGLSLGDRACLTVAKHFRATAVTAYRLWSRIPDLGVSIMLFR